jgi:hypothetical protein
LTVPLETRGECNVRWIEIFCLVPSGEDKGKHVVLTPEQRATVRRIYDHPDHEPPRVQVDGPLAAYLALLHVCGLEGRDRNPCPLVSTDIFTAWGATGPDLKAVLQHDGGHIVCPELGTRWPTTA